MTVSFDASGFEPMSTWLPIIRSNRTSKLLGNGSNALSPPRYSRIYLHNVVHVSAHLWRTIVTHINVKCFFLKYTPATADQSLGVGALQIQLADARRLGKRLRQLQCLLATFAFCLT